MAEKSLDTCGWPKGLNNKALQRILWRAERSSTTVKFDLEEVSACREFDASNGVDGTPEGLNSENCSGPRLTGCECLNTASLVA